MTTLQKKLNFIESVLEITETPFLSINIRLTPSNLSHKYELVTSVLENTPKSVNRVDQLIIARAESIESLLTIAVNEAKQMLKKYEEKIKRKISSKKEKLETIKNINAVFDINEENNNEIFE